MCLTPDGKLELRPVGGWSRKPRLACAAKDEEIERLKALISGPIVEGKEVPLRTQIEMADGCLDLIREWCEGHGEDMSATPPMMYPEAVQTVAAKAVQKEYARAEKAEAERDELRAKAQVMHDMHDSLGVRWGDNPYVRIENLKKAEADCAAKAADIERLRERILQLGAGEAGNDTYCVVRGAYCLDLKAALASAKKADAEVKRLNSGIEAYKGIEKKLEAAIRAVQAKAKEGGE